MRRSAVGRRAAFTFLLLAVAGGFGEAFAGQPGRPDTGGDVLVPGGTGPLLHAAGIRVPVEPERALLVLARVLHGPFTAASDVSHCPQVAAALEEAERAHRDGERVPALLPLSVWQQAVFERNVPAGQLASAIVLDRRASFLYYGLFALDEETLAFFAAHPRLVAAVYQQSAAAFAAYSEGIRIRSGRVQVPGGAPAERAWEQALGASPGDPQPFVTTVLHHHAGRLADLFGALGRLDPPHLAFAIGPSGRDLPALIASAAAFDSMARLPFVMWSLVDVPLLLEQVRVTPGGQMAGPRGRSFWEAVFAGERRVRPAGRGTAGDVTAAWLVDRFRATPPALRRLRLDALLFAQRRVEDHDAGRHEEWIEAVASFADWQTLLLTLEQMEVTDPADYRAAVAAGRAAMSGHDAPQSSRRLALFQAGLAIVARLAWVGTLPPEAAHDLARDLFRAAAADRLRYAPAFVAWIEKALLARLPPSSAGRDAEARLLDGLAGVGVPRPTPPLEWEGHSYVVDLARAERVRLGRVRERQGGKTFDEVIALAHSVSRLLDPRAEAGQVREAATAVLDGAGRAWDTGEEWLLGFRVNGLRQAMIRAAGSARDQPGRPRSGDDRRVLAAGLEAVLADVLVACVYALGMDPEAPLVAGDSPARRHDLGLGDQALHGPWGLGDVVAGRGVRGSLLGLDRRLARQALRPTMIGLPRRPPTLGAEEVRGLAESVTALNAFRLTDEGRDLVAGLLRRGRSRVADASGRPEDLDALLATAGVDGIRRRLAGLAARTRPSGVLDYVSLAEILAVGQEGASPIPREVRDRWGVAARLVDGSFGQRMPRRLAWRERAGRPGSGLLSAQVADLHIHVAEWLADRMLPASLAHAVLSLAMWELTMTAQVVNADDWLPVIRAAQALSADRLEDFVSALAAGGPLVRVPASGK